MGAYFRPTKLSEATFALASGRLSILAGGTDFFPARVGRAVAEDVLDITALRDLRGIEPDGAGFRIGALTTWTDLIRADLPPWFDGLKLAAREVGGVQIQNAGTLAGNLCNASPAADGLPNLLALDAEVELCSQAGSRRLPIAAFVLGNRTTARRDDELVTALHVPAPADGARATFLKLGARRYLVISIVMVAAVMAADADGRIADIRLAVGACSARPLRLPDLEATLRGEVMDRDAVLLMLAEHLRTTDPLADLTPIDDVRGSADYRRDAALTLVRRAVLSLAGEAA